jgi:hypothetical protein
MLRMKYQLASSAVLIGIAHATLANVPFPPASQVTIHFKGAGADHVLQALETLATPAGYVCSPSVAEGGAFPQPRGNPYGEVA